MKLAKHKSCFAILEDMMRSLFVAFAFLLVPGILLAVPDVRVSQDDDVVCQGGWGDKDVYLRTQTSDDATQKTLTIHVCGCECEQAPYTYIFEKTYSVKGFERVPKSSDSPAVEQRYLLVQAYTEKESTYDVAALSVDLFNPKMKAALTFNLEPAKQGLPDKLQEVTLANCQILHKGQQSVLQFK